MIYICCVLDISWIIVIQVYKYHKNLQLDHFLTAFVILALALVIGLGIGHFLGKLTISCPNTQVQPNEEYPLATFW